MQHIKKCRFLALIASLSTAQGVKGVNQKDEKKGQVAKVSKDIKKAPKTGFGGPEEIVARPWSESSRDALKI